MYVRLRDEPKRSGVGMKKLLAGVSALVTVGATGCFGLGTASADGPETSGPPPRGARATRPAHTRQIRPPPAGQVQGHVLARLFPGLRNEIHNIDKQFPGVGLDGDSVG